jgi:CO/xanthine dehydrogenase FAD-binding subunit
MYFRPSTIDEALERLARGGVTIVAGGTDFYPARVGKALDEHVVDITGVAALCGISDEGAQLRLGAGLRWSALVDRPLPPWLRCLALAAREIGGRQVQNAGTLVGNLCNASPAADGIPCLLALDASVELRSRQGMRTLPVAEFVLGNRRTALRSGELATAIVISKPRGAAASTFLKLGARRYLVISIAMVAALVETGSDGIVTAARVAVGACSAVAQRLTLLEAALRGRKLARGIGGVVAEEHLEPLMPIDDIRGTAAYRRDAARTLIARAIEELVP